MRVDGIDMFEFATYTSIFNKNYIDKEIIIEQIKNYDLFELILGVVYVISFKNDRDLKREFIRKNSFPSDINANISESNLVSDQSLMYLLKWCFAHATITRKPDISNLKRIKTDIIIMLQLQVADHLDISGSDSTEGYIFKNIHFNYLRNPKNDCCRSYVVFDTIANDSSLFHEKEFLNIKQEFVNRYGYRISDYISVMFSIEGLHLKQVSDELPLFNIEEFFNSVADSKLCYQVVNDQSHALNDVINWCQKNYYSPWDFSFFIKNH